MLGIHMPKFQLEIFLSQVPLDRLLKVQQPNPLVRDGNFVVALVPQIRPGTWTVPPLLDRD